MTHHLTRVDPRLIVLREGPKAVRQRWHLFAWGEVLHEVEDFEINEEFAREMLASFAALTDGYPYRPPILEEHEAQGRGFGIVVAMGTDDEGIWADVDLPEVVAAEIDAGLRIYISPSFYPEWVHPHTGEELRFVLREVSLVGVPHLKNLRPLGSHYSLSETGWATPTTQEAAMADLEQPETPETAPVDNTEDDTPDIDMAEEFSKLSERVKALEDAYSKMMEGEGEEEEMGEPVDNSEATAEQRIAALERTIALKDAEIDVRSVLPTAPMQEVTDLAETIVDQPKRGRRLLSLAERAYKAETKATTNTVQEPIGNPGASTSGPISYSEACDEIEAELGTTDIVNITKVLTERYPHLAGQTVFDG
jgi:hypothetical protein